MKTSLQDHRAFGQWHPWLVGCLLIVSQESFACWPDQVRIGGRCYSDPIQERIFDLIGYGIQKNGNGVVLATPVGSTFCEKGAMFNRTHCYQALPWRFSVKRIRTRPTEMMVSQSGTKLFLTYTNDLDIMDLQDTVGANREVAFQPTHELKSVSESSTTHRLPSQLYTARVDNQIHVIDDCQADRSKPPNAGSDCYQEQVLRSYPVVDAITAAVSPAGHEFMVGRRGEMLIFDPNSQQTRLLGNLPFGTEDVEIITAPKGEGPEFLVVYRSSGDHFSIIEPGSPSPLVEFSEGLSAAELRVAAQITACLLFHGESLDLTKLMTAFQARTNEPPPLRAKRYGLALAPLLTMPALHEDKSLGIPSTGDAASEKWRVRRIRPDPALYAPVLEMASGEPVLPSSTDIWDGATLSSPLPRGAKAQEEAWRNDWYDRMTIEARREKTAVYYRTLSFGGAWLMEYWVYYPFDVGGVRGHLHDEEHLFVEVDKLGGKPLSVLASAHTDLTPSNLYSSVDPILAPDAPPPTLPVFAFVELGKHAMAPDIDRDGHFTFGRDVNLYRETSQVWGVRDFVGYTSAHMETFNNSMMMPRQAHDQLAPVEYKTYFPLAAMRFEGSTYRLLPFSELGIAATLGGARLNPCNEQQRFSRVCGERRLQDHSDASAAWKIFKPWVYPLGEMRLGYVHWTSGVQRDGAVVSLIPINYGLSALIPSLALPGRLVPEIFFAKGAGYGFTYELQANNLFGWYAGGLWRPDTLPSANQLGGPVSERGWQWRGGVAITLPAYRPGTVHVQIGPVLKPSGGSSLGLEFRVMFDWISTRGRASFGRATDRDSKPSPWRAFFAGEPYPGNNIFLSFLRGQNVRPYSATPEPGSN
jgi:hypothetical protein